MWKKENLRKNFLRVKQIAGQNLGMAEKSEVLTEDQQFNEKRVDVVKQVCHNLIKKVTAVLEAPPGTDADKRLKKLPETSLSHALIEAATLLGSNTLLGSVCQECGDCESAIAREELQCELEIEREVITPLQVVAETDIPSILKHRKQLSKSTLDMDSAKNRFNSAVRQSHVPGANLASTEAKANALRDEFEEASNKVETLKDNLSIELCNFIAKEAEHSSRLVALLEAQATYHKNALKAIEEALPKIRAEIESSPVKPVFGMSLEDNLRVTERDISFVLEICVLTLLDIGMEEEGLFRLAGSALKMKKLKACFDARLVDMEEFSNDPNTVAGVMKQYLRELPEPMLTFDLYPEFMRAAQLGHDQKCQTFYTLVNRLPPSNFNNFRYLIKFLAALAEKSHINKMTPSNIAIVMGPNLLWARGENTPNMMTASTVSSVIETFVLHADYFFPGEIEFAVTGGGMMDSPAPEYQQGQPSMTASSPNVMCPSPAYSGGSPVSAHTSPPVIVDTLAPTTDSGDPGLSPKTLRRVPKKPAPPPPADRPYSTLPRGAGNGGQVLHRSAPPPPTDTPPSSGVQQSDADKRLSGSDRPPGPPPERPSAPALSRAPVTLQFGNQHPPGAPGGHQRSASTGAMYINTNNASPSAGSGSEESLKADVAASLAAGPGNNGIPSGTATLGRHRPARPQPPPPPPPINQKTEETYL